MKPQQQLLAEGGRVERLLKPWSRPPAFRQGFRVAARQEDEGRAAAGELAAAPAWRATLQPTNIRAQRPPMWQHFAMNALENSKVVVQVGPADYGWRLECNLSLQPAYFRSGACAEQTALALAQRLRAAGLDVRLRILSRTQTPHAVRPRLVR